MSGIVVAVDLFAGAGGTSTGIAQACEMLGRPVDLTAINHWERAINTHSMNHPWAKHICAKVESLDPREVVPGGHVDLLSGSPECVHFSRAAGGRPKLDQKRCSAWDLLRWIELLDVESILVENVPEFAKWGKLSEDGKSLKREEGRIYQSWLSTLRAHGYNVDARILNAADFGAATSRSRLFVVARKGKRTPIAWPVATYDKHGVEKPRWRAAREIIDWNLKGASIFNRKRPLSPTTWRRIEEGLKKFSGIEFLVTMEHAGGVRSLEVPLPTITTAKGGAMALVKPFILAPLGYYGGNTSKSVDQPLGTITRRGGGYVVEPFVVTYHGGVDAEKRVSSVENPIGTVATFNQYGLVEPCLVQYNGRSEAQSIREPLGTVTTKDRFALVEPFLVRFNGTDETHVRGSAKSLDEPCPAVVASSGHLALVEPEVDSQMYLDIRFRMLQPHELAAAMGFPKDYKFTGTKTDVVRQIGNAVVVDVARALATSLLTTPEAKGRLTKVEVH